MQPGQRSHSVTFLSNQTAFMTFDLRFSDACVEERGLVAWVCAHQQKQVRLLDASDPSVQEVV